MTATGAPDQSKSFGSAVSEESLGSRPKPSVTKSISTSPEIHGKNTISGERQRTLSRSCDGVETEQLAEELGRQPLPTKESLVETIRRLESGDNDLILIVKVARQRVCALCSLPPFPPPNPPVSLRKSSATADLLNEHITAVDVTASSPAEPLAADDRKAETKKSFSKSKSKRKIAIRQRKSNSSKSRSSEVSPVSSSSTASSYTSKAIDDSPPPKFDESSEELYYYEAHSFLSDTTCIRYLRARGWDMTKAVSLMVETILWRRENVPVAAADRESLVCLPCLSDPLTHCFFQLGFCKLRRPILYANAGRTKSFEVTQFIRHIFITIERTFQFLPEGALPQWVWVVDLNGFKLKHASINLARQLTEVFSKHFCERLGVVLCLNPSAPFLYLWNMVKLLLEKSTAEKVKVLRNSEAATVFEELFDDTEVVDWLKEVIEMKPTPGNFLSLPSGAPNAHNVQPV